MKRIKPVGTDIHLKYICPCCGSMHWLSLKESQTPNYISVCDICNNAFKVKTIDRIVIKYKEKTAVNNEQQPVHTEIIFDNDTKTKSINSLVAYGFTKTEAAELVQDTFDIFKTNDIGVLVKESLKLFGEKNG